MKTKVFTSVDGLELIVKSRKSAVIFEINETQLNKKYRIDFKLSSDVFDELFAYLESVSNESWGSFQPKEAASLGADYYEYYDREFDNNGYLAIRETALIVDRPDLESVKLYQFNKPKMESFIFDLSKRIEERI